MDMINNCRVYDVFNSIRASGYPMKAHYDDEVAEKELTVQDWNRAEALAKRDSSEGHDNFLSGLLISMDITATKQWWTEFQRYHFQQIVSSQSTMHRLAKMQLDTACIKHTDSVIVNRLIELQKRYNENPTDENFLTLIYSCPSGLKLTARVTTNYRQIKTMVKQRHNHRLPEWREFCKELPYKLPDYPELILGEGFTFTAG